MSLKKGQSPSELPYVLTLVGQGSSDKLKLTYHNRKTGELKKKSEDGVTIAGLIPWLVKEWDTDFSLTEDGVVEFDEEYPGVVQAVLEGWHLARRKEAEKN